MSASNETAWLDGTGKKLRIAQTDIPQPGPGEVLIKNHALAINPVDYVQQDVGMFVQNWPTVPGQDIAGEIVAVGEGVTDLSKGQRVLAQTHILTSGKPEHGGFQKYTVALAYATSPIPDDTAYEAAAVIPLGLSTGAAGLYQSDILNQPLPKVDAERSGKTIIVWGGSSSVGSATIQLAVASGLDVVTTASKKNFEHSRELGAKTVLDYNSPTIVEDLIAAVEGTELVGAFDAITARGSTESLAKVLDKFGGGVIACTLPAPENLPKSISAKMVLAVPYVVEAGTPIYRDFLPAALKAGKFKPAPPPHVIGHGIEHLQEAVDTMRKGVSAKKLVVTL